MNSFAWDKIGRIIKPITNIEWLATWTGASFARQIGKSSFFEIFITGRDVKNRSQIGKIIIDIKDPLNIIEIQKQPLFSFGQLGAFDENGVSYPWLFDLSGKSYMLYVGWMPTVLTPFCLGLGLAVEQADGTFKRVSRAPILERNDDDFLSIGSAGIYIENDLIRLYYTGFLRWGEGSEFKHEYVIKYAESNDAINLYRPNHICINKHYDWEFSICRPSVIKRDDNYHMWFSYRGKGYLIGYASSVDGITWLRDDTKAGISLSQNGWDSQMICYSHVFNYEDNYYMIYNGNDYGREGLGIAVLQ